MTSPLDQVKKVDPACLVLECEKRGCTVDLTGAPSPFKLIDMDHKHSPAKGGRCDFLFIGESSDRAKCHLYVAPLELKSSGFKPANVCEQLASGAKAAERTVPKVSCRFTPVVVHDGAHPGAIHELAKRRVTFRRQRYAIKVVRCGEPIADLL